LDVSSQKLLDSLAAANMIDLPDFDAVIFMEAFEGFIDGFILVHIQTDDVLLVQCPIYRHS